MDSGKRVTVSLKPRRVPKDLMSVTVATAAEKKAGVALRVLGRQLGDSRVDDEQAVSAMERESRELVLRYSTLGERRAFYFAMFDAEARNTPITLLAHGEHNEVCRDVIDRRTDIPIPLVRVSTAMKPDVVVYLTNMATAIEFMRFTPDAKQIHLDAIANTLSSQVRSLILGLSCPSYEEDVRLCMSGCMMKTTFCIGPFGYPWMAERNERLQDMTDVASRLRGFSVFGWADGERSQDVKQVNALKAPLVPWTLFTHIMCGKVIKAIAVLHLMNQLFAAWCPHNYSAVRWMTMEHTPDALGYSTPALQCRVAVLLLLIRYQEGYTMSFCDKEREAVKMIESAMNTLTADLGSNADAGIATGVDEDDLRIAKANDELLKSLANQDSSDEDDGSDNPNEPSLIDMLLEDEAHRDSLSNLPDGFASVMSPIMIPSDAPSTLIASDEDEAFASFDIPSPPVQRSRPAILLRSPILFPIEERCTTPMSSVGSPDVSFDQAFPYIASP